MTTIADMRSQQAAAVHVLADLMDATHELPPVVWTVPTTANLQGQPGTAGAPLAALRAWADHLGITLTERPAAGLTTYRGSTDRTAPNGVPVTITLYASLAPSTTPDWV